jgi:serine/threonine-protein kinase
VDVPAPLLDALASRYRIERELGRGGMAVVYLARDLQTPRDVALKVLRPELALAVRRSRFHEEINTLAGLVHPHIVSVHSHGDAGGYLYFAMEYVEGETLAHRIERAGPLRVEDVVRLGCEVADALDYAHRRNIVHRDVKPGNILLSADHAWVADFGIAKALAGEEGVTDSGFMVGTAAYMSPEQARSGETVDGRSDVYSLGCVLFEALTGRPPFVGDTPMSVLAQHQTDEAPRIRRLRPDVPKGIARVVRRCLAKRPEDRFATAAALCEALRAGDVPSPPPVKIGRFVLDHWRPVMATAALLVGFGWWLIASASRLDAKLIAVVPFGHVDDAAPDLLNGDRCVSLILEALGRWNDVALVDPMAVRSAMTRLGIVRPTLDDAIRIARLVGAGRLLWGEVSQPSDSIEITAALYQLTSRRHPASSHTVRVDSQRILLGPRFAELSDSLLLRRGSPAAALRTRSFAAWEAFADGEVALQRWELDSAESAFGASLKLDPEYVDALLGMAHARAWGGREVSAWHEFAEAAAARADGLTWRDAGLARALFALADRQYPAACTRYAQLVQRDSLLFGGWYGLAECHARDSVVERDGVSPTGWRFRSSYHTAARAYERALRLVPSMHRAFQGPRFGTLMERLQRVLYTEGRRIRSGYAVGVDTLWFAAFAELDHDTLAFKARPRARVVGPGPVVLPPTLTAAVRRSRDILLRIVTQWTDAFPASPDLNEALAHVLETRGEIAEGGARGRSAIAAVREARRGTREPVQALRLAAAEARLLVKSYRFAEALRIVDEQLGDHPDPTPAAARALVGLAALAGRAHAGAALQARQASLEPLEPLEFAETVGRLRMYAAVGQPVDSILTLTRRVEMLSERWVPVGLRRPAFRDSLLLTPAQWSFPYLGVPPGASYLVELQAAAHAGDAAAVRRRFEVLRQTRRDVVPGEVALDKTFQEAVVLATVGDSLEAARHLDATLNALSTLGTSLLRQVEQAAAVGRCLELRVRLAIGVGDVATARRWAGALAVLWARSDVPALRAVADSMRVLGRGRTG